jgi:hypothetical protein
MCQQTEHSKSVPVLLPGMPTHASRWVVVLFVTAIAFGWSQPSHGQEAKPQTGASKTALPADVAADAEPAKPNFDKVGPQVGDQVPALSLHTAKGEVQRLSDAWQGGPALLVTSSLTCPKSRSRWPEVKAIAEKYGDKLNVVIVYVIEAHPVGSICPYKGVEDITPENERDGILRRQPDTLEDRLELAQEFKRYLRAGTLIYIDNMKNEAWKALGAAPNLALLVDKQGIVVARKGWFEGTAMQKVIDPFVEKLESASDSEATQQDDRTAASVDLLESLGL